MKAWASMMANMELVMQSPYIDTNSMALEMVTAEK